MRVIKAMCLRARYSFGGIFVLYKLRKLSGQQETDNPASKETAFPSLPSSVKGQEPVLCVLPT